MAEKHYTEQTRHAERYLLPFFEKHLPDFQDASVLELGCAEGGLLSVLRQKGIKTAGLELSPARVQLALERNPGLDIRTGDITDPTLPDRFRERYDLIILRDVIEHVENREMLFANCKALLKEHGYLYVTFPPRFSPFAGHHQVGRSFLRLVPYLPFFPKFFIEWMGKRVNEYPHVIDNAYLNLRIGLTISQFHRFCRKYRLEAVRKSCYWIRPIYTTRFGWKTIRTLNIPFLREWISMGYECLLKRIDSSD